MSREYLHPLFTVGIPTYEGCNCAYYYEALPSATYYRLHMVDEGLKQGATKYTPRYRLRKQYLDVTAVPLEIMALAVERAALPAACYADPAALLELLFENNLAKTERERMVTNARDALIAWRKEVLERIRFMRKGASGSELNNRGTAIKIIRNAA